jgi:hypothetical protein
MIQRIQSLYLLIVVLLSVALFLVPVSSKIISLKDSPGFKKEISYKITVYGIEKFENGISSAITPNYFLFIINSALCFCSLTIIFLYKNRKSQMMLTRLSILLAGIFIAIDFYFSDSVGKEFSPDVNPMYLAGTYFPILQIILLMMALRGIKKDDELVRSADRIR